MLSEELLKEVTRLSGAKTYSKAVSMAIEEYIRRIKARQILQLRGTGTWEGDLSSMREDKLRKSPR